MNKKLFPLSILVAGIGLFSFNSSNLSGFQSAPLDANGPGGGKTGAPGEQSCTSCHSGTAQNGTAENLLLVNNDIGFGITQYTPGATYAVNLSMASNPAKKGFQVTALNASNAMAGSFTAGANTQIKTSTISGGQRKYATHKSSSNTSATQTWNWTWVAPSTNEGNVTFYVATNKANNNGNDNGDVIYLSQHVFTAESGAQIEEIQSTNQFNAGFSAEKNAIYLTFDALTIEPTHLNVVDINGKSVFSKNMGLSNLGSNKVWVELTKQLKGGIYVVHFFVGNKAYSTKVLIQQ
ncbi:MAG: choice-of-anchor V domain-containing protein [Flavobacteriales bacterium]